MVFPLLLLATFQGARAFLVKGARILLAGSLEEGAV